ncbi:MAG: RNA polymerase sigma factor RpoD/SigA, partial [Clostridiales bacterium]|nr:RNA polymerase sigma factor RpoD/SigA [Clostridiales bacterium]
ITQQRRCAAYKIHLMFHLVLQMGHHIKKEDTYMMMTAEKNTAKTTDPVYGYMTDQKDPDFIALMEAETEEADFADDDSEELESDTNAASMPGAFDMMVKEIISYPLLTVDEEKRYGRMLKGTPEEHKAAVEALTLHNRRYVIKIAKRFLKQGGMDLEDLVQEGTIGLLTAADRYDVDMGYRFSTYATWWIRQSIGRAMADKNNVIRYPVHMREKFYKMEQLLKAAELEGKKISDEEISEAMHLSIDEVRMLKSMSINVGSLNSLIGDEDSTELIDMIPNQNAVSPEDAAIEAEEKAHVRELMQALPERERKMIELRFGIGCDRPHTLEEIGKMYGLSRERVRQIERKAIRRMKTRSMRMRTMILDEWI